MSYIVKRTWKIKLEGEFIGAISAKIHDQISLLYLSAGITVALFSCGGEGTGIKGKK